MKKQIKSVPEVHISVNKNRVKRYPDDSVYLENGVEFQLEFSNKSEFTQNAVIYINGVKQHASLVLRPGEHYYLDRFMDDNKKMKFKTYEIEDSEDVEAAVAKNGLIQVKFYKRIEPVKNYSGNIITIKTPNYWDSGKYGPFYQYCSTITCNNSDNTDGNVGVYSANVRNFADVKGFYDTSQVRSTLTLNNSTATVTVSNNIPDDDSLSMEFDGESNSIETGRVESGSISSQKFVDCDYDFEYSPNHIVTIKLKPVSVKKRDSERLTTDSVELRNYCSNCGRRIKKGWKFCSGCGQKI